MYHDIRSFSSARIARFGRGGAILRARGADPLELEQIAQAAPSILASDKHSSRSDRYTYIPTIEVLGGLAREGFHPFEVRQGGTGDAEKRAFTKHMIRLRQRGTEMRVGGSFRELVLINSHDGTSSYQLMAGMFRLVCSNGLVVGEGVCEGVKVPHKGDIVSQVIEGAYRIVDGSQEAERRAEDMQRLTLSSGEQDAFAEAAAQLRWDGESVPVETRQVVAARRREDVGADLWRTFNRAQENLTQGGISYRHRSETGRISRRETRPVNGIDGNVALNRALWTLAQRMQELKAA